MVITHKLRPMDLTCKNVTQRVDVMQDDKYSRCLEIPLRANGDDAELPEDVRAVIRYQKPDGTGGNYDTLPDGTSAYTVSGNVITVALAPQVCTVPGVVQMVVCLMQGSAEINTFVILVNVHANPGIDVESQDYTNMRAYVKSYGWPPDKTLRTDADGNVIADDVIGGSATGGYYTPSIDTDGNLTWTASNPGMPEVGGANIKGPTGKTAYQYAQDGGYTGTEAEFTAKMAADIPTVDSTLTQSGQAADAATVGERLSALSEEIANLPSSGGSGLSSSERSTLIAVVNAIGTFNVTNGKELIDAFNDAWDQKIPATGITLSAASLSFAAGTSQALTASVEPSDSTDTVVWSSSNPAVATVSNGVVTPVSNGDCIITATAGSVSASCAVNVAFAAEVVYYTITNNLTNCTSDNSAASVVEGGSYTATIIADDGYTLDGASVSVVVNGEDETDTAYSNGVITVHSVTSNVVITVAAVESGSTEEVTLLKSITNNGDAYIDTDIVVDSAEYHYEYGVMIPEDYNYAAGARDIFGVDCRNIGSAYKTVKAYIPQEESNNNNRGTAGFVHGANDISFGGYWNSASNTNPYPMSAGVHMVVKNGSQDIYMDEEHTTKASWTFYSSGSKSFAESEVLPILPIRIFGTTYSGAHSTYVNSATSTFSMYYLKIYDDVTGTMMHELRPAKHGEKIGMYDTVTGKFYENAGIGTFSYEEVA